MLHDLLSFLNYQWQACLLSVAKLAGKQKKKGLLQRLMRKKGIKTHRLTEYVDSIVSHC
uniref:Uncharacterized protein n=1 Tax=Rhizophora mucronata TaxID=61149 RepID=A0A2P2N2N4_RHIMU